MINLFRIGSEAIFVALFVAILAAVVTTAIPGRDGQLVASGEPGHPWVYHGGLLAAGITMIGIVMVLGLAFLALSGAARRSTRNKERGANLDWSTSR